MSFFLRAILERICVGLVASLALFATRASAQPAFELELLTPAELRVAPGHSVEHGLRIRNVGNSAGPLRLIGGLSLENRFSEWPYRFSAASNPRCGSMPASIGDFIDLTTDSLTPGEALDCRWMVHRPSQSMFDIYLVWTTGSTPATSTGLIFLGTLTDISVHTQPLSFHVDEQGIGRTRFALTVENRGPVSVRGWGVGACYYGDVPVIVEDSAHSGGCGEFPVAWAPVCFTGGGYGFGTPELAPGQRHQCTFDARTRESFQTPVGMYIDAPGQQSSLEGGTLLDSVSDNNQSWFIIGPTGSPLSAIPLDALHGPTPALLISLLGVVAILSLAPRRRRSRNAASE